MDKIKVIQYGCGKMSIGIHQFFFPHFPPRSENKMGQIIELLPKNPIKIPSSFSPLLSWQKFIPGLALLLLCPHSTLAVFTLVSPSQNELSEGKFSVQSISVPYTTSKE